VCEEKEEKSSYRTEKRKKMKPQGRGIREEEEGLKKLAELHCALVLCGFRLIVTIEIFDIIVRGNW
jgi:hypothetical protein